MTEKNRFRMPETKDIVSTFIVLMLLPLLIQIWAIASGVDPQLAVLNVAFAIVLGIGLVILGVIIGLKLRGKYGS